MKTLIPITIFLLLASSVLAVSWEEGKEWLEISKEYKNEMLNSLENSKEFTADQLEVINGCLDEATIKKVLNCFSRGGFDESAGILIKIRDELGSIRERICDRGTFGSKDTCEKFGDSLATLKDDLKGAWAGTIQKGKQYLEDKNRLLFMKRKICKKIGQEGCYQWLNERIELKCNTGQTGNDPAVKEKCQLTVVDEVWNRLESNH